MTIYDNMKFPRYAFREYPKYLGKDKDGKDIIAESMVQELGFIAMKQGPEPESPHLEETNALAAQISAKDMEIQALKEQMEELKKAAFSAVAARGNEVEGVPAAKLPPTVTAPVAAPAPLKKV